MFTFTFLHPRQSRPSGLMPSTKNRSKYVRGWRRWNVDASSLLCDVDASAEAVIAISWRITAKSAEVSSLDYLSETCWIRKISYKFPNYGIQKRLLVLKTILEFVRNFMFSNLANMRKTLHTYLYIPQNMFSSDSYQLLTGNEKTHPSYKNFYVTYINIIFILYHVFWTLFFSLFPTVDCQKLAAVAWSCLAGAKTTTVWWSH